MNSKTWNKYLLPDEKIEYECGVSTKYILYSLFILILLSIFMIPIVIVLIFPIFFIIDYFFYIVFYLKLAYKYAFTNKRIIAQIGWLSLQSITIDYSKITDVVVQQTFLGRILTKSGNLFINTSGSSNHELIIKDIDNPYQVKQILDKLVNS
jgi:uncharacterized membrane protein YdbT with pleckstrin-like domain